MDFLLDPNVAYLILLGGVLLAMLALAAPGTGLFEVGAFFCIALAGYAIYHLVGIVSIGPECRSLCLRHTKAEA